MLDEFRVENLALIAEARLELGPGFTVITGETGAGKTLLLGALRLLRGDLSSRDLIGPAGSETIVEGRLDGVDGEIVLMRRVTEQRSRAYVDGSLATAKRLAETVGTKIEIVGQHDHIALSDRAGLRRLIDGALDAEGADALDRYREAWSHLEMLRSQQEALGGDRHALEREREMARFQADEIAGAGFAAGSDAELDQRATRLRYGEALGEHLNSAMGAMGEDGVAAALDLAIRELQMAARIDSSLAPLVEDLEEVATLAAHSESEIGKLASSIARDPAALSLVEHRLALLGDLKRKYGDDLDAVLEFGSAAAVRATELDELLDRAEDLATEVVATEQRVVDVGRDLHMARTATSGGIVKHALGHLEELGFSNPVLELVVESIDPGPFGADSPTLRFASDRSLRPGPLARVASGGELSRIVLALRLATTAADAATVAFDEIDAGVGGQIALALGEKLASLAGDRQVLCVTHLPQVAAFANEHFVVERSGTVASVHRVEGEGRLEEISRMLAGLPDSERGKEHAAELLDLAHSGTGSG